MKILSNGYEIISELGHGAHTKVYLANYKKLNVLRAVKYIKKSEADSIRYLQEANLIKNLKHSGIPIIYDIDEDKDSICIIEEYISGKSMTSFMLEKQELSLKKICEFGIQICEILEYLHSFKNSKKTDGILHLDLKPDNIMITEDNVIKIIDYDNASFGDQELKQCIGSKGFAAPEQYHRLKMGKTADIYGLGILLLYMSTSGYVQSCVEKIRHKKLKKIIKKCTKHNPIQRYDEVYKVKLDLQKILSELSNEYSNEYSNESLEINLVGTKHGIGTTHISICLTNYLNKKGIKTVCVDCTNTNNMLNIVEKGNITSFGTYKLYGAYLLPNYNDCINVELNNEYEIIVKDLGVSSELAQNNLSEGNNIVNILVGGGKYYEQNDLQKSLASYSNCVCILNHLSGKQFYSFIQNNCPKQKMYRMPCVYDWNSNDEIADEMFDELLDDLFPTRFGVNKQKNVMLRRCISNILKKKKS